MTSKILAGLVAFFAVALFLVSSASATLSISSVEVNGVSGSGTNAVFAGDTIPVRVFFSGSDNYTDVRVTVRISGESSVSTQRFDVLPGATYSKLLSVNVPKNVDPSEDLTLYVRVEAKDGTEAEYPISLKVQRESYVVEVLDAQFASTVKAGSNMALDIVLKNRGIQFAEDTFVTVSLPALGISSRAYFGDLSPVDQSNPDKEDATERRMYLNIPSNVPAGVYAVEIEAYNSDSSTVVTKKVAIVGASADTQILSVANSKTFGVGQTGSYTVTLVNTGDKVAVYQISVDSASGIQTDLSESIVAVPAGSSKTVKLDATASKAGTYNFAVTVTSGSEIVSQQLFTANVSGSSLGGSTTVLLTVILAIVFIVLLVVLIVLLTRKPEKQEEFGESYY